MKFKKLVLVKNLYLFNIDPTPYIENTLGHLIMNLNIIMLIVGSREIFIKAFLAVWSSQGVAYFKRYDCHPKHAKK
jgi:hypothetical protein